MNGRIYDPLLGRFLSADILVSNPAKLQSYNRYTYVGNNPLSTNDPSGYETPEEKAAREKKEKEDADRQAHNRAIERWFSGGGAPVRNSNISSDITTAAADKAQTTSTHAVKGILVPKQGDGDLSAPEVSTTGTKIKSSKKNTIVILPKKFAQSASTYQKDVVKGSTVIVHSAYTILDRWESATSKIFSETGVLISIYTYETPKELSVIVNSDGPKGTRLMVSSHGGGENGGSDEWIDRGDGRAITLNDFDANFPIPEGTHIDIQYHHCKSSTITTDWIEGINRLREYYGLPPVDMSAYPNDKWTHE